MEKIFQVIIVFGIYIFIIIGVISFMFCFTDICRRKVKVNVIPVKVPSLIKIV